MRKLRCCLSSQGWRNSFFRLKDGSRRVYMLRRIADVLVNTEIERRVTELEERATSAAMPLGRSLPPPMRTVN